MCVFFFSTRDLLYGLLMFVCLSVCNESPKQMARDSIMNLATFHLNERFLVLPKRWDFIYIHFFSSQVNAWCNRCNQWGMKLNPIKIHSLIISRSSAPLPLRANIIVDNYVIKDITLKLRCLNLLLRLVKLLLIIT